MGEGDKLTVNVYFLQRSVWSMSVAVHAVSVGGVA